jgi:hypothetical protein
MSSSETLVSQDEGTPHIVRRHKSTACIANRRQPKSPVMHHAHPNAYRANLHPQHQPAMSATPSRRAARVASSVCTAQPDTQFKYIGSAQQRGWEPGQVPLFLEWFPEKLDRRSNFKFFESGREYTMGRSPKCDFFFKNTEADSGISALHLKIKVHIQASRVMLIEDSLGQWTSEQNLCLGYRHVHQWDIYQRHKNDQRGDETAMP